MAEQVAIEPFDAFAPKGSYNSTYPPVQHSQNTSSTNILQEAEPPVQPQGAIRRFIHAWARLVGFRDDHNVLLWFNFGGAMVGFCLARFMYLSSNIARDDVVPGEWYYYGQKLYNIGFKLHIAAVTPGGIMGVLQFVPKIRQKIIMYHRIEGYLYLLLQMIGVAGALIIMPVSMGGSLDTQTGMLCLAVLVISTAVKAYINVKRGDILGHRRWMLRNFALYGVIITIRLVFIIQATVSSAISGETFVNAINCAQLDFVNSTAAQQYDECRSSNNSPSVFVAVKANYPNGSKEQVAAAFRNSFGAATWLAIVIHLVVAEIYIRLTEQKAGRDEKEKLKEEVTALKKKQDAGAQWQGFRESRTA